MDGHKVSLCRGLCHLLLVVEPERPLRKPGCTGAQEDNPAKENECPKLLSNGMVQGHLQNGSMQMLPLYTGEKETLKQSEVQQTLLSDSSS